MNENLKEKRIQKGISMRKLAEKTGLAVSTIYRVENTDAKHNKVTLKIINDALEEEDKCQTTKPS